MLLTGEQILDATALGPQDQFFVTPEKSNHTQSALLRDRPKTKQRVYRLASDVCSREVQYQTVNRGCGDELLYSWN